MLNQLRDKLKDLIPKANASERNALKMLQRMADNVQRTGTPLTPT